jgi:nicotinamidase-related amidase
LLVIDIQEGITGEYSKDKHYIDQSTDLIKKVNQVITTSHEAKIPIVYIRQRTENWLLNWVDDYALAPDSPGVAIDKRIKMVSLNHFPKRKSDAFSNYELDHFLRTLEVDRLMITGLDIAFCAGRTSLAALNRGYKVVIIEDAVISETNDLKIKKLEELRVAGVKVISTDQLDALFNE